MDYKFYLFLALFFIVTVFTGCASQRPVLYPNQQFKTSSEFVIQDDIDDCIALAEYAGLNTKSGEKIVGSTVMGAASGAAVGAATGAVAGHAGRGAATGAAGGGSGGFMWGLFNSKEVDPIKRRFIEQCLREKGYQIIGWK